MSLGHKRLFEALKSILRFSVEERRFGNDTSLDGWIMHGADAVSPDHITHCPLPCYIVMPEDERIPCGTSSHLSFSKSFVLGDILKNRQIHSDEVAGFKALPEELRSIEAVAWKDGAPIWGVQKNGKSSHYYVSLSVPVLSEDEPLFSQFNSKRFLSLLPLFIFITSLSGDTPWKKPPLRAAFMFDDPNLHWSNYGFIKFNELLEQSRVAKYHVSFATIPLDGWFVHSPTAALFRNNQDKLSLLIHGNDHVSDELSQPYSEERLEGLLRQSLDRISKLEKWSGLSISKVMTPPHGACSEQCIAAMAKLGFEAACISSGSLIYHNKGAEWVRRIGMQACDQIAGLPVFQRFGLSKTCQNNILISAFLHQPIIPRGHHIDVADGYQLLNDVATFINGLGNVCWSDLKTIARSQYETMVENNRLCIKMLTNRIRVRIPEGISILRVELPDSDGGRRMLMAKFNVEGQPIWNCIDSGIDVEVRPGTTISVRTDPDTQAPAKNGPVKSRRVYPVVRRIMTETRDRLYPYFNRIGKKSEKTWV
jgi:hypothetical protein